MSNENKVVLPEPVMNEEGYIPCPFCGSYQVSLSTGEKADGEPWHYVECESCTATAEPEKWNERALLAGVSAPAAHSRTSVTPNGDKWKLVDGDMREAGDGLLTYHAGAYREGLADGALLATGGQAQAVPVANCYSSDDGDTWQDSPEECGFVEGRALGEEFELQASIRSWAEVFRVTKVPDETSDDYEVEPVSILTTAAPQSQADARDADGMYYLQDARHCAMVGNCPSFWRPGGNGYTTNLDEAERFTFEEAMKQHQRRETDLPWRCSEVDKLRRPTVDCQYMPRSWDAQRESIAAIAAAKGE